MVFICLGCNLKKADRTLARFIKLQGLSRETVEARLVELGKDF